MFSYSCENVTRVEFESNKASVRQGFPDSVLRINYFLGAFCYTGSFGWEDSTLMLHQSEKFEVLGGAAILNSSCREGVVLAGGSCSGAV